jgi:hypothetical protein
MKQETLEETAFRLFPRLINDPYNPMEDDNKEYRDIWISSAKWQQETMYSEEDLRKAFSGGRTVYNYKSEWEETYNDNMTSSKFENFDKWFEQFKNK